MSDEPDVQGKISDREQKSLPPLKEVFFRHRGSGAMRGLGAMQANLLLAPYYLATLLLPLVMSHVLQSYPTGEEFLKNNGFDPALVRQVTDRKVHVMPRTKTAAFVAAVAHSYFLNSQVSLYQEIMRDYVPDKSGGAALTPYFNGPYTVIIPCSTEMTSVGGVERITGIPAEKVERALMSDREVFLWCVLHELRHTSSVQDGFSPMMKESDSDGAVPMRALFNVSNNERALQETIYKRILQPIRSLEQHHMGLYLDAFFRNHQPPTTQEVMIAEIDALQKMVLWLNITRLSRDEDKYVQYARAYRAALAYLEKSPTEKRKDVARYFDYSEEHSTLSFGEEEREAAFRDGLLELPPLARRFAELYVEGVEYFAPSSVGLSPTQAPPPNNYTVTGDVPGVS